MLVVIRPLATIFPVFATFIGRSKKKKEVKKEKVILFSYESSVPQNCLLDWQLSLLVIHLFKLGGGNYPVFPLGVKSYG